MMQRMPWTRRLFLGLTAATIALSAREAVAAARTLRQADCSIPNWCALGQKNCNDCCGGVGICVPVDPNSQGCICVY